MQIAREYTYDIEGRFRYPVIVVVIFFLVIFIRLYFLQVINGDYYFRFAAENSIKEIKIQAPRGVIYDRRGQVLVDNQPLYQVVLIPQYVVNPESAMRTLQALLGISHEELEKIWAKRLRQPRYQPVVVKDDASLSDLALIRARKGPWYEESEDPYDLRGIEVRTQFRRLYPESDIATHLLGYVREIDAKTLEAKVKESPDAYSMGDQVGVSAIEAKWDLWLRGEDGYEQRAVDAVGREIDYAGISDLLENKEPVPGASFYLSLDRDLQQLARDQFAGKRGAVVMVDVANGGLLAAFSAPSFDLNKLGSSEGNQYWSELSTDRDKPLLNRMWQGTYPPASTFKITSAIAVLSEKVAKPEENVNCGGAYVFGGRPFHCWQHSGHGPVNLHGSLLHSCDVYYYAMSLRLGVDKIMKYARILGFGEKTQLGLGQEKDGLMPSEAWKQKRFGTPWQAGENLSIAVGQGYDLVTPLQNAMMIAKVASGGYHLEPYVLDHAVDQQEKVLYQHEHVTQEKLPLDPNVLEQVRVALVEVGSRSGALKQFKVPMAGKTGTAQVVALGKSCGDGRCRDHAWFTGFAPAEHPKVAVAVIVENGGFGAAAAAPIAGALMQKYFDIEESQLKD